jgi:hypothetical protein
MTRQLAVATVAWVLAVLAAIMGVVLPSNLHPLALALFVFAVVASVGVAILLLLDGLRQRPRRRRGSASGGSPLDRLEYLPAVTTRTRRLQWRGGRHLMTDTDATSAASAPQDEVNLIGSVQSRRDRAPDVTGSAYPPPASSTTPPQSDTGEAAQRGL